VSGCDQRSVNPRCRAYRPSPRWLYAEPGQNLRVRTFCTSSRRPHGAARAAASRPGRRSRWRAAPAGPTPVGWRKARGFWAAVELRKLSGVRAGNAHAPAAELSEAGQNPSRPSVAAGQPHPWDCVAQVHAKTTLTEPTRPREWQRSEAWTRVARVILSSNPLTSIVVLRRNLWLKKRIRFELLI
jgi:hypothetical protein